ncbi:DUF3182 family protein [Pseudomonas sp. v388]|uniref:DUF3182 family protein n=1 Tax=Pseudomonas sp. v388 TaxID=2479849 RepID=UPI000F774C5D|nr:DUF3182 family protein [Pseudomonas sp. v388]RRV04184.1 DUF3182 family protein [Pseudomonas sp. v388]
MSGSRTGAVKAEVVLLPTHKKLATHELAVHEALGRKIASLLGARFGGLYDSTVHDGKGRTLYFVPSDTLIGHPQHRHLDIQSADDLFGGLIAEPFMATKAISHPLLDNATARPAGWSDEFHRQTADAVLAGFSVFNHADALEAGKRLLVNGPIRIKPVLATAGRGQLEVTSEAQLAAAIEAQDSQDVNQWGLVLEENLQQVVTYSVGQISIAGLLASYYGTQSLTRDNQGESVYGGSSLRVVRGGFDALLALELDDPVRHSIKQAMAYDRAASSCFQGLVASRRNYDIAMGVDAHGQSRSGVLEQSWRIGGASAAEIEALLAFADAPALQRIDASTHEVYGETTLPRGAEVLFEGDDPQVGFITKYTQVEPYERSQ